MPKRQPVTPFPSVPTHVDEEALQLRALDVDPEAGDLIVVPPSVPAPLQRAIYREALQQFGHLDDLHEWLHASDSWLGGTSAFEAIEGGAAPRVLRTLRARRAALAGRRSRSRSGDAGLAAVQALAHRWRKAAAALQGRQRTPAPGLPAAIVSLDAADAAFYETLALYAEGLVAQRLPVSALRPFIVMLDGGRPATLAAHEALTDVEERLEGDEHEPDAVRDRRVLAAPGGGAPMSAPATRARRRPGARDRAA